LKPESTTNGRFYASVIGLAPRALVCSGCKQSHEIVLGLYRGDKRCRRCKRVALFVIQGQAAKAKG
jgi:hypothetical protein